MTIEITGADTTSAAITVNGDVTSTNAPLLIPSSPLGMLAILTLGIVGLAGLMRVRPIRRQWLPVILLAVFFSFTLVPNDAKAIFANGGFETGDITGWTSGYGLNYGLSGTPPFNAGNIKISNGGMKILAVVGNTFDPRAPQLTLPRQGNFTAKINDDVGDRHLNYISQKDTLTEADRDPVDGKLHVRFTYAAVLSDPNHSPKDQPYFHIQLKDLTTGSVLYDDFAFSNQPGRFFFTTWYRSEFWISTPFVDVDMEVPDTSVGHEIEIRALAADCSLGAHGGYVYVDAFSAHRIPPQGGCLNGLKARGKPGEVQLVWPDNGAVGYRVYRAPALDGPYEPLGETGSRYSTWLDQTTETNKTYYYNVRPLDIDGAEICTSGEVIGVAPETWSPGDPRNRPPYFISAPVESGDTRAAYAYTATAVDADNDPLRYSLLYGPVGMTVEASTGQINWQPDMNGFYRVNVAVNDGHGHIANQAFTIEVTGDNRAPVINNPLPTRIPPNVPFKHNLQATDPDGDPLVYSIGSQVSDLTVNAGGIVSWSSPQPGSYPVTVVVADNHGAKAVQQLVLIVSGPVVTSTPVTQGSRGVPYQYQIEAHSQLGQSLSYAFDYPAPAGMTIDPVTGLIKWPSPIIGSNYYISVNISDGVDSTSHSYRLTISSNSPVVTSTPVTHGLSNALYQYQIEAYSPLGLTLSYAFSGAPAGMTINPATGLIRWPSPALGNYTISVNVSDGVEITRHNFSLVITTNAPVVTSTPVTQIPRGTPYQYQIEAYSPIGLSLSYAFDPSSDVPVGMVLGSATGLIEWPSPAPGYYYISVSVSDGAETTNHSYGLVISSRAPVVASSPPPRALRGVPYQYQIGAYSPIGLPLSYAFDPYSDVPTGMTIDPVTGLIEWPSPVVGGYYIWLIVSDGTEETQYGFSLTISSVPVITSDPVTEVPRGAPYQYQIEAYSPLGLPLSYAFDPSSDVPTGMTINPVTGLIEWSSPVRGPSYNPGYYISVVVSDGTEETTQSFYLSISSAPVVTSDQWYQQIPRNVPYQYQIEAYSPLGLPLSYALDDCGGYCSIPAGMTIDPATGLIKWASPVPGSYYSAVVVSDGEEETQWTFALTVSSAPVITSDPVTSAPRNVPYRYQIEAYSPAGLPLSYALDSSCYYCYIPAGMTIDSTTGLVEWLSPAPAGGTYNEFRISVKVSDGLEETSQTFNLTISSAPVITSDPVTVSPRNAPYRYQIEAYSPIGLPLSYSFYGGAPAGMTIDPATGLIEWLSPVLGDRYYPSYYIRVIVSDGVEQTQHNFYLLISSAPVVTSDPGEQQAPRNVPYRYQVEAYSPIGLSLSYTFNDCSGSCPTPNGMTINPVTGLIEWLSPVPVVGYSYNYYISVIVSDGVEQTSYGFSLTISSAPVVTSDPITRGFPGTPYRYQIEAHSPIELPLSYTFDDCSDYGYYCPHPPDMILDPVTGLIEWLSPIPGDYNITVIVSDGVERTWHGFSLSISFAPVITSNPVTQAPRNVPYRYQIEAYSPQGRPLSYVFDRSYSGIPFPPGMTLNRATGLIEWLSPVWGAGYEVKVIVSDGAEETRQDFYLTISSAPVITSDLVIRAPRNVPYRYQIEAYSPIGLPLSYAIYNAPAGMTFDPATGLIEWASPVPGKYYIFIDANDGVEGNGQTLELTIY